MERRREWLDGRPRRRSRTAKIAPILAIAGLLFGVGGLGWAIVAFKPFQGMGWSVASLPVIGLLAGVVTTAIFPRRDPGGIIVTMIIGIVGALLGGFVVWAVSGAEAFTGFFGLRTWLTGVAGSTFLLLLYRAVVNPGRRRVI